MQIRNTRYYAEQVAADFPLLEKDSVVATCTAFMRLFYGVIRTGHEMRFSARGANLRPFSLKVYRQTFNVKKANVRALRGASRRRHERKVRATRREIRRDLKLGPAPDLFQINP